MSSQHRSAFWLLVGIMRPETAMVVFCSLCLRGAPMMSGKFLSSVRTAEMSQGPVMIKPHLLDVSSLRGPEYSLDATGVGETLCL